MMTEDGAAVLLESERDHGPHLNLSNWSASDIINVVQDSDKMNTN